MLSSTTRDRFNRLDDEFAFARVGQHLPRQVGGPAHGLLDNFEIGARRLGGRQTHQGQFGITEDSGEDVVEVVGNSAGQHADAFQLLGMEQPAFQFQFLALCAFFLADIANRAEKNLFAGHRGGPRTNFDRKDGAVLANVVRFKEYASFVHLGHLPIGSCS